jgi:GNAT superfamily N-acetyltransferase
MDTVRLAQTDDRQRVVASITAAFDGDPAWSFLLADGYPRLAPLFAGALFDLRVDAGDVWMADDGSAASLWEPPGTDRISTPRSEEIWAPFRADAGPSVWARLMAYEEAVDGARPTTPYWYLGVLATRPDRQRTGLATAVMTPILDRADAAGLDCCLETSTLPNRAFYERRGFTEVTDVTIASGPPTWWLRRPPQN